MDWKERHWEWGGRGRGRLTVGLEGLIEINPGLEGDWAGQARRVGRNRTRKGGGEGWLERVGRIGRNITGMRGLEGLEGIEPGWGEGGLERRIGQGGLEGLEGICLSVLQYSTLNCCLFLGKCIHIWVPYVPLPY